MDQSVVTVGEGADRGMTNCSVLSMEKEVIQALNSHFSGLKDDPKNKDLDWQKASFESLGNSNLKS